MMWGNFVFSAQMSMAISAFSSAGQGVALAGVKVASPGQHIKYSPSV
jgi:hypothetical protein